MAVDLISFIDFDGLGVLRIEKDVVGGSTFYGFAKSNEANKATPEWLIARESIAGNATELIWASEKFDQIWNNRANLFANPPFANSASILFQGSNQHINIGNVAELNFDGTGAFSISAWFRTISNVEQAIISKQGSANNAGWRLTQNSGRVEFHLSGGGTNRIEVRTNTATYANGSWHHVLLTYDGSQTAAGCKLYVDGVDAALTIVQNALSLTTANSDSAQIGIRNNTLNDFDGFLDEIAVWNLELDSSEAADIYNSGVTRNFTAVGPQSANLVGWWRTGDNDIFPTITDLGTGQHDGTMINMQVSNIVGEVP